MTMGPDPIIKIFFMSVLFGIYALLGVRRDYITDAVRLSKRREKKPAVSITAGSSCQSRISLEREFRNSDRQSARYYFLRGLLDPVIDQLTGDNTSELRRKLLI